MSSFGFGCCYDTVNVDQGILVSQPISSAGNRHRSEFSQTQFKLKEGGNITGQNTRGQTQSVTQEPQPQNLVRTSLVSGLPSNSSDFQANFASIMAGGEGSLELLMMQKKEIYYHPGAGGKSPSVGGVNQRMSLVPTPPESIVSGQKEPSLENQRASANQSPGADQLLEINQTRPKSPTEPTKTPIH